MTVRKAMLLSASCVLFSTSPGLSKSLVPVTPEIREKMMSTMTFQDPSRLEAHGTVNPLSIEDILEGPKLGGIETYLKGPKIYCGYDPYTPGGTNPKFRAHLTNMDMEFVNAKDATIFESISSDPAYLEPVVLKVKYQTPDPTPHQAQKQKDMYTEVFAALLVRSMGFAADLLFPSEQVVCRGCLLDPFTSKQQQTYSNSIVSFPDASVEIPFPGITVERFKDQGFSFAELDKLKVAGKLSEQTRIEFEGVTALASLLTHSSNVANQQRLVCPNDKFDPNKNECLEPVIGVLQDLGSILGSQNPWVVLSSSKANLQKWTQTKVWKNPQTCTLALRFAHTYRGMPGTYISISEEGRQFIVSRIKPLIDDPKLKDLRLRTILQKSKLEKADYRISSSMPPSEIINGWVHAFKTKYDELTSVTCPASPLPVGGETRRILGF